MNSKVISECFFFYVNPILFASASLINMLSCFIVARIRKNNKKSLFTYLLTSNVINSIGCFGSVFWFLSLCGSLCRTSTEYWIVWSRIFINYLGLFAYNWSMFNQISISFSVYFSLIEKFKRIYEVSPCKVNIGNIFLSACFSIVTNIINEPVQRNEFQHNGLNTTIWVFGRNEIGKTSWYYYISFSCRVISYGGSLFILIIINILILIFMRKFQLKRREIFNTNNNSKSDKRLNCGLKNQNYQQKQLVLVFWLSCLFCVSRIVDLSTTTLISSTSIFSQDSIRYVNILNNILFSTTAISYVFICYYTNKIFRQGFKDLFKSLKAK
jgi:hypothetical protein